MQVHLNTRLLQAMATKIDSIGNADDLEENWQGIDINFPISTKGDLLHANNLLENEDHRRKLVSTATGVFFLNFHIRNEMLVFDLLINRNYFLKILV